MKDTKTTLNNSLLKYHPFRFAEARKSFINKSVRALCEDFSYGLKAVFYNKESKISKALKIFIEGRSEQIKNSLSSDPYPSYLRYVYKYIFPWTKFFNPADINNLYSWIETLHRDDFMLLCQYTALSQSGNNIFEFSQQLLDLFWDTDVNNVLLADIHLPFPTVYLHFGTQKYVTVYDNIGIMQESLASKTPKWGNGKNVEFYLEGAYVSQCSDTGTLAITLTTTSSSPSKYYNNCIDSYEETNSNFLNLIFPETTVAYAIENEYKKHFLKMNL